MRDILLEYELTDRAGRGVYGVSMVMPIEGKDTYEAVPTGQRIRFDLDGNLHIKVESVVMLGEPDEPETHD